jgi:hypothetical protein
MEGRILAAIARPVFEPFASRWYRVLIAIIVAGIGLGLATWSPANALALFARASGLAVQLAHGSAAALTTFAGLAAATWSLLVVLGRATLDVVLTGPALMLIALNVAIALISCAGLKRLLAPREECA